MNWSDIFYPGNPERREKLIRKSQELIELMKNNFRATNQLIEVLNECLGCTFCQITLKEKATVKENCDALIERIHQIQAKVKEIDDDLKKMLEPTLYEKLKRNDLSIPEQKQVSVILRGIEGCLTLATTFVVSWLFTNLPILASLTGFCRVIAGGLVGGVVFWVLFMGIDMIVQAILGSIERSRLERALKEYDDALEDFRPASEKYQDGITEVRMTIQIMKKHNFS